MAFTVTRVQTVFGNKGAHSLRITADDATQTIETGLKTVEWISLGVVSAATMGFKVAVNSNASGVQSFGVIGISGVASGDDFFVTCYGPR